MKFARSLCLALAVAAAGAPSWAAQPDKHQGHHPAGTAAAPALARMDAQMKTMREMHDKMMAAKTPEERNALMAEHMKAMQEGMTMMITMPADGMGGNKGGNKGGMKGDMAVRHQMMEKRMEMMQATMQMMMDRLPAVPPK